MSGEGLALRDPSVSAASIDPRDHIIAEAEVARRTAPLLRPADSASTRAPDGSGTRHGDLEPRRVTWFGPASFPRIEDATQFLIIVIRLGTTDLHGLTDLILTSG